MTANICNICFETMGLTNQTTTPRGHTFCFTCILEAYKRNATCPCCRTSFQTKDEEEEEEDDDQDFGYQDFAPLGQDELLDEGRDELLDEGSRIRNRRYGRVDEDDCYHYPAKIETMEDLVLVLRRVGVFNEEMYLYAIMNMQDPDYDFTSSLCNHDADIDENELAATGRDQVETAISIFKRTQVLSRYLTDFATARSVALSTSTC